MRPPCVTHGCCVTRAACWLLLLAAKESWRRLLCAVRLWATPPAVVACADVILRAELL